MGEAELFRYAVFGMFGLAGLAFVATYVVAAPYGRHSRGGWGPKLPVRLAWVVMEGPSVFLFAAIFLAGPRSHELVPLIFLGLWLTHYAHRALLYPLTLKVASSKAIPLVIVGMGFSFNVLNSYLNSRSLTAFGPVYPPSWLSSVAFQWGVGLFIVGFAINRWADSKLRALRSSSEEDYAVPRGGLYELISCPNYFGELVQWIGWAIATWSLAGLAFAVFTAANLVPRAIAHHRWYRETFEDYPGRRKAVVPFLL